MADDITDDTNENHPQHARIQERAYLIWERDGRPDGHALAHWVRARHEIADEDAAQVVEPPKTSSRRKTS